ncbi:protein DpdE [Spirillospora sp. NPDC048819]|uniref:protein DpdE n=1 Tax=Spirillospora sp. NPDC048819 TaxID=3155268 RepID=UPI0033F0F2DD
MARLAVGELVEYRSSPGVGRVIEVDGAKICVEFFESVATPRAATQWVLADQCRRTSLDLETRIFWRRPDTGDWLAGRIKGHVDGKYYVQFPNYTSHFPVSEQELRVRWDRPVVDPVSVLTSGGNESAYYYNARMPFLRNLVEQRAASASIPALLSAGSEIFPHQVNTALTVLSDPVQRYLLADEVGLGKTIETGHIIRQTLIDDPHAKICVLTPDVLRRQWGRELVEKFFTDDFPMAVIKILAHEAPERWADHHGSDLVVVDEAHQLAATSDPNTSPYRELAALAHSSPRLLLLSATPVMSHRTTQLGMLHLLDPVLYQWSDQEAFEHKHRLRSRLADSVNNLDAEFTYMLPTAIEEILEIVPAEDTRCADLSRAVLELLDEQDELRPDADLAELKARTEGLRAHISEAYRLHRRVIRHRRSTVLKDDPESDFLPYEVRGRRTPQPLPPRGGVDEMLRAGLAGWRSGVWDHLVDHEREDDKPNYAMALAVLTSRATGHHQDFLDALAWRLEGEAIAAGRAGLTAEERALLSGPDILDVERAIFDDLHAEAAGLKSERSLDELISTILPGLKGRKRAVVFCGPGQLGGQLADRLRQRFPSVSVFEHTQRSGPEKSEQAVTCWAGRAETGQGTPQPAVLVVDDSAEDGLNLQVADAAVHIRLPWSPNRLEQRLGRIDRYRDTSFPGQIMAVAQFRVGDPFAEDSLPESWTTLLTEGYGVFDDSVSTLQDAIATGLTATWSGALESGVEGFTNRTEAVSAELKKVREEIDKMDMLEAIHDHTLEERNIAADLQVFEYGWKSAQSAMLDYTGGAGGVKLRTAVRTIAGNKQQVFDLAGSQPLIDPRHWRDMRAQIPAAATQGVFNRSVAVRSPATRPFRSGNPLVDALSTAIYHDDRGQASAFRRIDRRHQDAPVPYFGFDFLVEADLSAAQEFVGDQPHVAAALRRQGDRLLAPFTLKVWIEAGVATPLTHKGAIVWLDQPYDKRRDKNYNAARLPGLIEIFGGWDGYRETAERAEQAARKHLADVTDLEQRCAQAQSQALRHIAVIEAQAQTRKAAGHLLGDTESLLTDVAVTEALTKGLTTPVIKVVAVTCIVRAGLERIGSAVQ